MLIAARRIAPSSKRIPNASIRVLIKLAETDPDALARAFTRLFADEGGASGALLMLRERLAKEAAKKKPAKRSPA